MIDEFQGIVNGMTNHERNQWARAGYPGLRPAHDEKLLHRWLLSHRAAGVARVAQHRRHRLVITEESDD